MLAKDHRLRKQRDFAQLYQRGERLLGRFVLIRILANRVGRSRIGVVISTKVAKRATVRNRHKRHIRAVVRQLLGGLPGGWDILITVRQAVADRTQWVVLREEVRSLLERRFLR